MVNGEYLFDKKFYGDFLTKNFHSTKKLGCEIIGNALVLPNEPRIPMSRGWGGGGGVVDSVGKFVPNSWMNLDGVDASYTPKSIRYNDETVIYLGMFRGVWGHCLTDNIKRMWFLKSDLYQKYFKGCPLIYIPMYDFDFETKNPTFKELIEILGIDCNSLYPIREATRYKNLILPDMSFNFYNNFTDEYVNTIDTIRDFAFKHRKPLPFSKVYMFHGRNQIGEERIAQYFQSKGYVIISPEKLSFKEQLNIFINCDSFASPIGSCAHNSLFLKDNSEVLLIPRAMYITGYQELMNQMHNLKVTYIDSSLPMFVNNDFPWGGPFFYFLGKNLLKYFGDIDGKDFKYSETDFKNFILYLKICQRNGLKFSEKALKYYEVVFKDFINQLKRQKALLKAEGIVIN